MRRVTEGRETKSTPDRRRNIAEMLAPFGAPAECVVRLDERPGPEQLPHLDLRSRSAGSPPVVDAVVEMQHRPVLYVVRGPKTITEVRDLCQRLAQRGVADHLGVVEPGILTVHPLLNQGKRANAVPLNADDETASSCIPNLAMAVGAEDALSTAQTLHKSLASLLDNSIDQVAKTSGISNDDALSLVGRALFFRFLIDRRVISEADMFDICPGATSLVACMDTPERVSRTCSWLNKRFNGNLLPLHAGGGRAFWSAVAPTAQLKVCSELSKILLKLDQRGQSSFKWATLDFGHIPVGMLSEVYELHCHRFAGEQSKRRSVHYTPRAIAEYMVDEALSEQPEPHRARILDPAVGAGVFLVASFRSLVAAWWRKYGKQPRTRTIRRILYSQLYGFDVSESALRLAALSLYLTALELDPSPRPLSRLRFENLRGRVLFDVRSRKDRKREILKLPVLGSLGLHVSERHRGAYDIVVGNPPWTTWERPPRDSKTKLRDPEKNREFDDCVREVEFVVQRVMDERFGNNANLSFEMADHVPDVPFFWRAMEWANKGGRIALAMHGRLLFKRSKSAEASRAAVFRGARILGILNGAALRETRVWPNVKAPFCMCFAENRRPVPGEMFTYVSPVLDTSLNRRGHVRIDAANALPLSTETIEREPWLLKTLFRGTALDVSVMQALARAGYPSLKKYLEEEGITKAKRGTGYQIGGKDSKQHPSEHLLNWHDLTIDNFRPFVVDVQALSPFVRPTVAFARSPDLYLAPIVLFPESPGPEYASGRAAIAWEPVAFNESFYGISCNGHRDAELLARYLLLLLNSRLLLYFGLMQSGKFGVERYALEQQDIERFPVRPISSLDSSTSAEIMRLSQLLFSGGAPPTTDIDKLVGAIYGLSSWDLECVEDALAVSLPYEKSTTRAEKHPSESEISLFAGRVESQISPILRRINRRFTARPLRALQWEPWAFLEISAWSESELQPTASSELDLASFTLEAERVGATRIVYPATKYGILTIGILAQYRYWTPSRARLLALDLLREYGALLLGQVSS